MVLFHKGEAKNNENVRVRGRYANACGMSEKGDQNSLPRGV